MSRSLFRSSIAITCLAVVGITSRAIADNPQVDFGTFVAATAERARRTAVRLQSSAQEERAWALRRRRQHAGHSGRRRPARVARLERGGIGRRPDRVLARRRSSHPCLRLRRGDDESGGAARRPLPARKRECHDHRHRPDARATRCDGRRGAPSSSARKQARRAACTSSSIRCTSPRAINVTNRDAGTTSDPLHLVKRKAVGSLVVRRPRDPARRHDDLRGRAGAKRRQRRRRHLQVRAGDSVPGQRPDHGARHSRRSRRARSMDCAWRRPGRRTGARAPRPATARGSRSTWPAPTSSTPTATSSCATPSCSRSSPATTGRRTWTSIRSPPRRASSARAGRTPAARATTTAAWSRTAASRAKSCASSRIRRAPRCRRPTTGTIPTVERFITGSEERAMYDNVAFQPHTGNLVVLEDGSVDVVKKDRDDGAARQRSLDVPPRRQRRRRADRRVRALRVDPRHDARSRPGSSSSDPVRRPGAHSAPRLQRCPRPRCADQDLRVQSEVPRPRLRRRPRPRSRPQVIAAPASWSTGGPTPRGTDQ